MSDDALRLSDADRDLAAADLGEHFAQGRLSVDEHAERLDRIWSARTRGELTPIFRDLPGAHAVPTPRTTGGGGYWSGRRHRGLPTPLLVVLVILFAVTLLTHLPFIVLGLLVWAFVASRRRHEWHRDARPYRSYRS